MKSDSFIILLLAVFFSKITTKCPLIFSAIERFFFTVISYYSSTSKKMKNYKFSKTPKCPRTKLLGQRKKSFREIRDASFINGYMSFRPTPFQPLQFQPLQFQPLQFQPFTLSTVLTFNRLQIQPLANSTATNSTYLIKFKVIQFFQDVRKLVK